VCHLARRQLATNENASTEKAAKARCKNFPLKESNVFVDEGSSATSCLQSRVCPSDYGLFRSMQHFLKGRQFESFDEVEEAGQEFFDSKPKE
jgi:hypothetical protein